jgi:hypothetical protein
MDERMSDQDGLIAAFGVILVGQPSLHSNAGGVRGLGGQHPRIVPIQNLMVVNE